MSKMEMQQGSQMQADLLWQVRRVTARLDRLRFAVDPGSVTYREGGATEEMLQEAADDLADLLVLVNRAMGFHRTIIEAKADNEA